MIKASSGPNVSTGDVNLWLFFYGVFDTVWPVLGFFEGIVLIDARFAPIHGLTIRTGPTY
jgi:hypothetical protein